MPGAQVLGVDATRALRPAPTTMAPARRLAEQRIDPGARAVAHHRIEHPAREQEGEQHQRAIEPGMVAALDHLVEAECRRQRSTPIEIGTSMLVVPRRSAFQAEAKNGRPA